MNRTELANRFARAHHKTCELVGLDGVPPHDFDDHVHSALAFFDADPELATALELGLAFAAALEALPERWHLMVGQTDGVAIPTIPEGLWWATGRRSYSKEQAAETGVWLELISSEDDRPRGEKQDATPTAALEALIRQVRARKPRAAAELQRCTHEPRHTDPWLCDAYTTQEGQS